MRRKLALFAAVAILPSLAILVYNESTMRRERAAEVRLEVSQAARQVTAELDQVIEAARSLLITASAISAVADMEPERCNKTLAEITPKVPSLRTVMVVGLDGNIVCHSLAGPMDVNLGDRPYIQEALKTPEVVVGRYTVGRLSGDQVLPVALAIRKGGVTTAVLVAGIKISWLQSRIERRGLLEGGSVTLADRDGYILARNPQPERFIGTRIPAAFMHLVTATQPGTLDVTSQDGTERIIGYEPTVLPHRPVYVSVGISKDDAFAPINRASVAGMVAIAVGLLISMLAAGFVATRLIVRPIDRIVGVLRSWEAGQTDTRTHMRRAQGDLGEVGAAVDHLLDELSYREHQRDEAETARALLGRELSHRVKNSLSLVQIIVRQAFRSHVPDALLRAVQQRIRGLSGAYDVLLAGDWQESEITATVHAALEIAAGGDRIRTSGHNFMLPPEAVVALSLILHELATNATKYGALSESDGYVTLDWSREENRVTVLWSEWDGPPLSSPLTGEGFGSTLIRNAFPAGFEAKTRFDWEPDGLKFHLNFRLPETT